MRDRCPCGRREPSVRRCLVARTGLTSSPAGASSVISARSAAVSAPKANRTTLCTTSSGRGVASSTTLASALLSGASTSNPGSAWKPRVVVTAALTPGRARRTLDERAADETPRHVGLVQDCSAADLGHRGAVGRHYVVSDAKLASDGQHVGQRAPGDQSDLPAGTIGGQNSGSSAGRQLTAARQQRAVDVERQ